MKLELLLANIFGLLWYIIVIDKGIAIRNYRRIKRFVGDYWIPTAFVLIVVVILYIDILPIIDLKYDFFQLRNSVILNKPNIIPRYEWLRFVGTIGAVGLGLFVYRQQRQLLLTQIVSRLSGELTEIHRHLGANIVVLNMIDSSKGIPSLVHIRKLEISKYSSLSSEDVLKNLNKHYNKIIFPMTVCVRNYNMHVQIIVKYLQSESLNEVTFNKYKSQLIQVSNELRENIKECLDNMVVIYHLDEELKSNTKSIIYDRKWEPSKNRTPFEVRLNLNLDL